MASPKLAVPATSTTLSSSSRSAASFCASQHISSLNSLPEAPTSPMTTSLCPSTIPAALVSAPVNIAVILEELRILQQRQIHQMQMTEEICRQVLRLGEASCNLDSAPLILSPLPFCLEGSDRTSRTSRLDQTPPPTSVTPLLACFSTLLPSQSSTKPSKPSQSLSNDLHPHKPLHDETATPEKQANATSTHSFVSSSSSAAISYPLSLSFGLPTHYSYDKSSNTITSDAPSATADSEEPQHSAQGSSAALSSGRLQHACRFCGKLFSSDSSLQIHLRSHTGERPYQCPVCLSRFTTRGNLKVHFLRHREQNPELSFSLLSPSLFVSGSGGTTGGSAQTQLVSSANTSIQDRQQKRRAEDDLCSVSLDVSTARGALSTALQRSPPSSLPLPPSIDLALLTTARSLLQLNCVAAAAAAAAAAGTSISSTSSNTPSLSSSSLLSSPSSASTLTGLFKGAKQQRFDENTPPVPDLLPRHLPKILFPAASSHHHPAFGLLRSSASTVSNPSSGQQQITFSCAPYPKDSASSASSLPTSTPTSDTSKLQKLVEKLEKEPQTYCQWLPSCSGSSSSSYSTVGALKTASTSTTYVVTSPPFSTTNTPPSSFSREMMAALGMNAKGENDFVGTVMPNLHFMTSAGSLTPNQCSVCLRVLSCPRALRLHQATHLGERPFSCKLCGRSFSTKGSLRAHLATHRARPPNNRTQNSCPLCQRKFTNAVVLQHHIRMHLGGHLPAEGIGDHQASSELSKTQVPDNPSTISARTPGTDNSQECSSSVSAPEPLTLINSSSGSTKNKFSSEMNLPSDLSSDQSPNHTLQSTSADTADPPVLCASVSPLAVSGTPSSPLALQSVGSSVKVGSPANNEYLFEHPIKTATTEDKTISPCLAQVSQVDHAVHDRETHLDITSCESNSNLENLLSMPTHNSLAFSHPLITTPPSLVAMSPENCSTHPRSLSESDHDIVCEPKSFNPDPNKEGDSLQDTTRTASRTVSEDNNAATVAYTVEKTSEGPEKSAADSNRMHTVEARKDAHSNLTVDAVGVKDASGAEKEQPEPVVSTSLAPSLLLSRPDKKTYCCSECGKEYASRSGLKGHMKHHGVTTHAPARSRVSERHQPVSSQNLPITSSTPPATRASVSFLNQYQARHSISHVNPKESSSPDRTVSNKGKGSETSLSEEN
ncbi:putative GPI-anchored protein pfl2 [Colossoma macropomum]|uniref:putative GPI-anchored protein pfl2 n=1 Tax=Colossoma macropomum TaxID=42526 RepID=UPI0018650393|nr:putative GPI-anchored protein pfl2 [Colossoma macropomum]